MNFSSKQQALTYHQSAEVKHRRCAMMARVTGRDPELDEVLRDRHHDAVVALTRDLAPVVRKVA